jgi:hypothetical protein
MRYAIRSWIRPALCAAGSLLALASQTSAQGAGTAFTYQGSLTDAGAPANGPYDFQFLLYTQAVGGTQVGPVVTLDDVVLVDGLFTISLDFGPGSFAGEARFLETGIRPGASTGAYTVLAAREELKPAPHAVFSQVAPWAGITGKPPGFADGTDNDVLGGLACASGQVPKWNGSAWACAADAYVIYSAGYGLNLAGTSFRVAPFGITAALLAANAVASPNVVDGSIANADLAANAVTSGKIADGSISFADLGQNGCSSGQVMEWTGAAWGCAADTTGLDWSLGGNSGTAGGQFLGTTDNAALELKVNNVRALRLEPMSNSPNIIGGYWGNSVTPGAFGGTVAGGGEGGGGENTVTDSSGTVGGGRGNQAGDGAGSVTDNIAATVGGGFFNTASGAYATVGGGGSNSAQGISSTIAGGGYNRVDPNAISSTIGGGSNNFAGAWLSTIGGGTENTAGAESSTVGGGHFNLALGEGSTVPGGLQASALLYGQFTHAAGMFAERGDAQTSVYVMRRTAPSQLPAELFLDGASARLRIRVGESMAFDILLVARTSSGAMSAAYRAQGLIENDNGSTHFIPPAGPLFASLGEDDPTWSAALIADDVNDALAITVSGKTGARWVASVRTVEVAW